MIALHGPEIHDAWANSGGPMSRRQSYRLVSSLLGTTDGPIPCPRREVLALSFGDAEPVSTLYQLLGQAGLRDPEELRPGFGHKLSCLVCRPAPGAASLEVATANAVDVLRQAFLLGLCTNVLFDPDRPVLWTQASLTRRLELFDITEFYA
jgi:hypothetical protein